MVFGWHISQIENFLATLAQSNDHGLTLVGNVSILISDFRSAMLVAKCSDYIRII